MDIALIDVTELEVDPKVFLFAGKWPFGRNECDLFGTWDSVNLSRRMSLNEEVAKIGRTSGVATGYLHNIQGNINISLGGESHKSVDVYAVQSSKGPKFSLPGDSGSFVFAPAFSNAGEQTKQHRVIGLLIGATQNGDFGYFIPFDAVIDEIEALTGGKVIWPVQSD